VDFLFFETLSKLSISYFALRPILVLYLRALMKSSHEALAEPQYKSAFWKTASSWIIQIRRKHDLVVEARSAAI
jgi:hypothetical protein